MECNPYSNLVPSVRRHEAVEAIALEAGKVSSSRLQEKLDIGYARAMRLIDMLIDRNVIADDAEHIVLHHSV